jgi:hypothetical protein
VSGSRSGRPQAGQRAEADSGRRREADSLSLASKPGGRDDLPRGHLVSARQMIPASGERFLTLAAFSDQQSITRMAQRKPSRELVTDLSEEERLVTLNNNAVLDGQEWKSVDETTFCHHCDKEITGRSVRIFRNPEFEDGFEVDCGTEGCNGSPLDWSKKPRWRGVTASTSRRLLVLHAVDALETGCAVMAVAGQG